MRGGDREMRLFKVFFTAAALTVVLMAMAAPARAVEFKTNAVRCNNDKTDPDLRIGACTWLLNSGRLAEKSISSAYNNRGNAYRRKGQYDRAIADHTQAIKLNPKYAGAYNNRGYAYDGKGEYDRAIADYGTAIGLNPKYAMAYKNRGNVYLRKGDHDAAMRDYNQAIALNPHAAMHNGIAWKLATMPDPGARNGAEAVRLAEKAVKLKDIPSYRDTLAAAYAEAGRFDDAVAEQDRAIAMLRAAGRNDKIADYQSRRDLYRQRRPYRQ